jgi:hypothetical protein
MRLGSALLALGIGFILLVLPRLPESYLPWTPLDLGAPPVPLVTWTKLQRMGLDAGYCRAALGTSALGFTWLGSVTPAKGCPVENAVRVAHASVGLSSGFLASCRLAGALDYFFRHAVEPDARRDLGQGVRQVVHLGSFACRSVIGDHGAGNVLSQHASANAIDIAGFMLDDGSRVTVADDWRDEGPRGRFLHDVHDDACGIFHAVLGPDFNAVHHGHFHLDMGFFRICR